jgi:hypothetical protein
VFFPVVRRFVALLLALALFAPGSAFGRVLYACSMSGKISAGRCCCHGTKTEKLDEATRSSPRAERPDCCETQDHRRAAVNAATSAADVQVLAAAPTQLLPAVAPAASAGDAQRPAARTARGPPGAAVYVLNCSFLI